MANHPGQARDVTMAQSLHPGLVRPLFLPPKSLAKYEGAQHRNDGEGQQQGAEQRGADRDGHGAEHAPFQPLQKEDRKIDGDDDANAKCHWPSHLKARSGNRSQRLFLFPMLLHSMHRVFDHHHSAIDNHAEINSAKANQVGADDEEFHPREGEEKREWNDRSSYQCGGEAAKKQQQNDGDQDEAFEEVVLDRVNGSVNDRRLIVEGLELDARRKMEAGDLLLDQFDDMFAVLAFQHDDHARDGLAIPQYSALAGCWPNHHLRDIMQHDRRALVGKQDNVADVVDAVGPAKAAQGVLFIRVLDVSATEVGVVLGDTRGNVLERQSILLQQIWIYLDLVLPGLAAPGIYVTDAGDRS